MGRKTNLGRYPDPGKGYTSARAGNQLFFNASGGLYAGAAYLDTERDRVSETDKNGEQLFHHFALAAPCAIRPGTALSLSYAVFAGRGGESHAGRLSNLLWRLNWARDPGTHVPQTDIRSLRANAMTTWEKTALRGLASHDHFAAHFFTNFHGQFPKGTYIRDQFGCSWLSYDLLKARHYLLESRRTGDARYRRYARNIVAFYADHHFVGRSRLTYCFHTGSFT